METRERVIAKLSKVVELGTRGDGAVVANFGATIIVVNNDSISCRLVFGGSSIWTDIFFEDLDMVAKDRIIELDSTDGSSVYIRR